MPLFLCSSRKWFIIFSLGGETCLTSCPVFCIWRQGGFAWVVLCRNQPEYFNQYSCRIPVCLARALSDSRMISFRTDVQLTSLATCTVERELGPSACMGGFWVKVELSAQKLSASGVLHEHDSHARAHCTVCVCASNTLLPFSPPFSPLPFPLFENAATDVSQGPGESLCLHSCRGNFPSARLCMVWFWVRPFSRDSKQSRDLSTLHFHWFGLRRNALNWCIRIGFENHFKTKGMWFPCLYSHLLLINISGWIKEVENEHFWKYFLKISLRYEFSNLMSVFTLSYLDLLIFYSFMWLKVEDMTYLAQKICGWKKSSFFLF